MENLKVCCSLIFLMIVFSCQNSPKEKANPENTNPKVSNQTPAQGDTNNRKKNPAPPPPPPPPSKSNPKTAQTPNKNKIQAELNQLEKDTRRIIQETLASPKPTFSIEVMKGAQQADLPSYFYLECEEDVSSLSRKYALSYTKTYAQSQQKTGKSDGQLFCLSHLSDIKNYTAKIIYARNEGGHYADEITLITLNEKRTAIFRLPLVSWFSKDGYDCKIESELVHSINIKRKIVELFGWRAEDDKQGIQQPRRETIQTFKLFDNGNIKLSGEEVTHFNFDSKPK